MKHFKSAALAFAVTASAFAITQPVFAETATQVSVEQSQTGDFIRKRKKLKGSWDVVHRGEDTFIVFSDDFRAANGPDLKIFLSPTDIGTVTGDTAVNGSINLGELQSTRGRQEYKIPGGVNLADYKSVLVHCEAYSVLWGGSDF